jgi:2-polyprenyl-3-methyl-5-hydroxy-6-metoxy-1,4-benzoquinol methylase
MKTYASTTTQRNPNQLVLDALKLVRRGTRALDVGAGSLCDSRLLLSAGLQVDAVDVDPFFVACARRIDHPRLYAVCEDIRDLQLEANIYCLIVAIHVLPFIPRSQLAAVCAKLVASLDAGGALCATFFGIRDEWAQPQSPMSFVTPDDVTRLFPKMALAFLEDYQYAGRDVHGNVKQWHVIRVIFRKPD